MLDRVTNHAVLRYLQRVLNLPVDDWCAGQPFSCDRERVAFCCERAELPVDAVKELIMSKPVMLMCMAGFQNVCVRLDGFAYIIRQGFVVTILTDEQRDERIGQLGKIKQQSRDSMRREILKRNRRSKGKFKNRDRRLAEVD
ncbi:hypothetical protein FHT78_005453 [Rhizobium sp. BK196]|uniref:hypothetical protein n=1 Tax=Rhizobium sp. BK196 TaxID=2587073 RepID=UPI00160F4A05|nr:hypothetical protein [Rhizobium sp. BK196]MBB3313659.1 hypothetical protein [Rhizobium sp. BK196]